MQASRNVNVLWIPGDPTLGWHSSDRYWRALEKELAAERPPDVRITRALRGPPKETKTSPRAWRYVHRYWLYPYRIRKSPKTDVVHLFDHSFAHLLPSVHSEAKKIVTVHDLAPLRDPEHLSARQVERFRRMLANLKLADVLLAVSEFTASDLVRLADIPESRIRVLPMGADVEAFSKPRPRPAQLPHGRLILSVGNTLSRKNLRVLPEILSGVAKTFPDIFLIRVGELLEEGLRTSITSAIGTERLIELGKVPDEQLPAIYQHCDVFIFPSLLEGFGLPIVEAMAAGCPVVSSNSSSLTEVGLEAVSYFEPLRPAGAALQIIRALVDSDYQIELIERGRVRARELSWKSHFSRLTEIYGECR